MVYPRAPLHTGGQHYWRWLPAAGPHRVAREDVAGKPPGVRVGVVPRRGGRACIVTLLVMSPTATHRDSLYQPRYTIQRIDVSLYQPASQRVARRSDCPRPRPAAQDRRGRGGEGREVAA
jgi:hypothetical protein